MIRFKKYSLIAASVCTVIAATAAMASTLPNVTDSYGRELALHGFSSSNTAKWNASGMSWETQADMMAQAKQTGASAVRLTIFWALIEPVQGQYNDAYLAQVAQRVAMYKKANIQVILDMHQDLFGPYYISKKGDGSVNGAPAWATFNDGLPINTNPINWGLMYFQPGIEREFDHLWGTMPTSVNLKEAYALMWQHVAKYFANNDNVIGYDLFNEPFHGGKVGHAEFEKIWLPAFYKSSMDAIRLVDPNKWFFVEPEAFVTNQALWRSSLPIPKDIRQGAPHVAYAPHEYILPMEMGNFTGANKLLAKAGVSIWFKQNVGLAKDANVPLWIGEFGAGTFSKPGFIDYIKYVLSWAKYDNAGWAYWATDSMKSASDLALAGQAMAEPYAKAVPGKILENDYAKNTLQIKWLPRAALNNAPLEIYLPSSFYPNGYNYSSNLPGVTTAWDAGTNVLSVSYPQTGVSLPETATFTVTSR